MMVWKLVEVENQDESRPVLKTNPKHKALLQSFHIGFRERFPS